jgi:hypothetical protein
MTILSDCAHHLRTWIHIKYCRPQLIQNYRAPNHSQLSHLSSTTIGCTVSSKRRHIIHNLGHILGYISTTTGLQSRPRYILSTLILLIPSLFPASPLHEKMGRWDHISSCSGSSCSAKGKMSPNQRIFCHFNTTRFKVALMTTLPWVTMSPQVSYKETGT